MMKDFPESRCAHYIWNCLPFRNTSVHPVFSGVRFTRTFVVYVCFIDRCLSLCTFVLAIVLSDLL